jgi:hypothetical protein
MFSKLLSQFNKCLKMDPVLEEKIESVASAAEGNKEVKKVIDQLQNEVVEKIEN